MYQGSIWLADEERFQRYIQAAIARPCPTGADIRKRHKKLMQLAKDLPSLAVQGSGVDDPIELSVKALADAPKAIRAVKGKVGVIPIDGPVAQRMSPEMEKAGGTPLDFVSAAFDSLLANPSVGAIVLRFNSPGGSVDGVQELADKIYASRGEKPSYAIADPCAASAALWLASAAGMFVSTPCGGGYTVGSQGCYVMHIDESEALAKEGKKVTMISAGKYKTEMNSFGPPSPDAIAEVEALVSGINDNFIFALKRNRGTTPDNVRQNYGQGRMLTAARALSVGMIDRIMSFDELMAKLTGGTMQPAASRGPSAEVLRERLALARMRS